MLTNIKATIFDLDGTLVDSMWIWEKIDIDYLRKRNLELPTDLRECIEHLSFLETARYFKDRFTLPESIEEIAAEWNHMALKEYNHSVKLKKGAKEFLTLLKAKGLKIALATSNSMPLLEAALKSNGVFELFDVICRTDEVNRGKNFPDVYLLASERLGVSPNSCIVFEDLVPAVMGAKAAGMKVVAVHDLYSEGQKGKLEELADHYILNYEELA